MKIKRICLFLGWAVFIIGLDQFTKYLIVQNFVLYEAKFITSFFNLVRVHNSGAAFSFLANQGGWQIYLLSTIAVFASLFCFWQIWISFREKLFCFAMANIMGGALGNVVDRFIHGHVVDFLDFHWNNSHFAAFNVADMSINLGVFCLILDEILKYRQRKLDRIHLREKVRS